MKTVDIGELSRCKNVYFLEFRIIDDDSGYVYRVELSPKYLMLSVIWERIGRAVTKIDYTQTISLFTKLAKMHSFFMTLLFSLKNAKLKDVFVEAHGHSIDLSYRSALTKMNVDRWNENLKSAFSQVPVYTLTKKLVLYNVFQILQRVTF